MGESERIAVIIPTLATRERAPFLMRAIDCVLGQRGVAAYPLVIVNGPQFDPGLLGVLERNARVRISRLEQASMPLALHAGRKLVDTLHFSELDDDDELLPTALALRLAPLREDPSLDAVVANGIKRDGHLDEFSIPDLARVQADPLHSLVERNWLLPGSALFRSDRVTPEVFADIPPYLEWTWIGVQLASRLRVAFLPEPTVIHYLDRHFSIDHSREAALNRPAALERLSGLPLPRPIRSRLARKLAAAYHAQSALHLCDGNLRAAWRAHLRSLAGKGGWIYWSYTRHLLPGASS